jgi:hypothetical protein
MAGWLDLLNGLSETRDRQRNAMFDLSHGRCLRIDILEARVREARGRCNTEHVSLDVRFEDALGTSSAFKSIFNSSSFRDGFYRNH